MQMEINPPKYLLCKRVTVQQDVRLSKKPTCCNFQNQPLVEVEHTLQIENHFIDARLSGSINVSIDEATIGMCKDCWVGSCQRGPAVVSKLITVAQTYWKKDVVTLLCWYPRSVSPDFNMEVELKFDVVKTTSVGSTVQKLNGKMHFRGHQ